MLTYDLNYMISSKLTKLFDTRIFEIRFLPMLFTKQILKKLENQFISDSNHFDMKSIDSSL